MKFCFGDIVVVDDNLIGVVVKSFESDVILSDTNFIDKENRHDVYVREYNTIINYPECKMQRYMVRHKYLNEEEMQYQKNAIASPIKSFLSYSNKSELTKEELKKIFANNLRYYMDKEDINVTDLAKKLNIKRSTFADWYNAVHYPRIDQIQLLAEYFSITKSNLIEERRR